jgi:hypothetical protein
MGTGGTLSQQSPKVGFWVGGPEELVLRLASANRIEIDEQRKEAEILFKEKKKKNQTAGFILWSSRTSY